MHPEEQQLEGWGGRNLQSDSAWGKGGSKGREFGHVRRRKDDGTGREGFFVGGCRHTGQLGHEGAHPPPARGKGAGRRGTRTDGGEREGGGLVTIARGGFHGAQRRGGRHHRGDEDVAGCGATAPTPRESQVRRRTRAHACDAAPPARARLAAWAAAKCARASASASASDFASFASSAARSSPKRVETASSALRLACCRA